MQFTKEYIAEQRRNRRISYAQLKREDQMRSELGGNPREALLTGTRSDKERAVNYYANVGKKDALVGVKLDGLNLRPYKLRSFNLNYSSMHGTKLGDISGASCNGVRSVGLKAGGGDLSGTSWNYSMVLKGDMQRSNRRNMQAGNAIFAFTNSRFSDSENFKFHGIGVMNNHGDENLTAAKISGWNLYSNFNNAHAPTAEFSGRVAGSDFSSMDNSKGSFKVSDNDFRLHAATFDGAQVDFGNTRDADSANLDHAVIQNDEVAAMVELNAFAKTAAARYAPSASKYDVLKSVVADIAPTPVVRAARRASRVMQLAA